MQRVFGRNDIRSTEIWLIKGKRGEHNNPCIMDYWQGRKPWKWGTYCTSTERIAMQRSASLEPCIEVRTAESGLGVWRHVETA